MANSKHVNGSGAKAPDNKKKKNNASNNKQDEVKQSSEEWLESEVNAVDLDSEESKAKKKKNKGDTDSDALMRQAAEQLEKLQAEVKE